MGNGCMRGKAGVEVTSPTLPAFKVVVVGDSGSGKTSIIRRFIENRFETEYSRTMDIDITSIVKKLNVPEHAIVTVELWDVPGQNDVDLRKTYYLDVDAVIVAIDISRDDSLNIAGSWSLDVSNHARVSRTFTESVPNSDGKTFTKKIRKEYRKPKPGTIPVLLLGNKYDLAKKIFMKKLEEAKNQEVDGNTPQFVGEDGECPDRDEVYGVNKELQNKASITKTKTVDDQSSKNLPSSTKEDQDSAERINDSPQQHEDNVEVLHKPSQEIALVNGHVGNGDVPKHDLDSEDMPKKIHPKDEKSLINGVETETKLGQDPSPEDAVSAITMATSAMSVLPPCVEEIERIAEKYGFIAGVPVSAKTTNGGVQEAIQSILRRLVAKKLINLNANEVILERKNKKIDLTSTKSVKSSRSKTSSKTRKKVGSSFEALQEVGIIEIDEVIRKCNPPLHEAEDMTAGFAEALQGFKVACYKNGLVPSMNLTLEACISAVKQAVSMNFDPVTTPDPRENVKLMLMTPDRQNERQKAVLTLTVEEIDGFPHLLIININQEDVEKLTEEILKPEDKIVIQPKIQAILVEYRKKFLPICTMVSKHGSEVETVLGKQAAELAAKEEKAWETSVAAGLSPDDVRRILSIIAQDKARLRGTVELVRETRKSVQTAARKIKATVLF